MVLVLSMNACRTTQQTSQQKHNTLAQTIRYYPAHYLDMDLPTERLDLVRFHHTEECDDCFLIGEAVLDVLNHEYSHELEQGLITYRVVNSEYLENKPLLLKYEVMEEDFATHTLSSSLDQIEQHHDLWLITDNKLLLRQALLQIIQERLKLIGLSS
jgi:hypothetical protein